MPDKNNPILIKSKIDFLAKTALNNRHNHMLPSGKEASEAEDILYSYILYRYNAGNPVGGNHEYHINVVTEFIRTGKGGIDAYNKSLSAILY